MEILIVINLILSALLLLCVGYLIFVRKSGGTGADTGAIRKEIRDGLSEMTSLVSSSVSASNNALIQSVKDQIEVIEKRVEQVRTSVGENHIAVINAINDNFKSIIEASAKSNEALVLQLSSGLDTIRKQNNEKLDLIQKAVDEKLDATLSARLKASFDSVISQIGEVKGAVGEIKGLAKDVSSLNRVLTNVKTKGIVGEIALGNIISETLTADQYETNFVTKSNGHDPVEFAIKMPGVGDEFIYLPIDAKFPLEAYHEMKEASDALDKVRYDNAKKSLRTSLKTFAKKIHDKYIEPPRTTDFAIMFLPIEGLYVEALDMGLFEELQRDYKINIAGPSTLTALLNALQVGFKSLVIQKRSSQVFDLLGAVKNEFSKFGDVLIRAQKKFGEANDEIEKLVGTRTRMINSKLREITELDDVSTLKIIEGNTDSEE